MRYQYDIFAPASEPVSQFPEHYSVDITKDFGFKINELIENSPSFQLPVDYLNHIDFAFTLIA